MSKPKVGFISLFAGLYDSQDPTEKDKYLPFMHEIASAFEAQGVEPRMYPVCVHAEDVRKAVEDSEQNGACAIVVLFLAYHPSLVSADTLSKTRLPLIFIDTTMSYDFGFNTSPAMIGTCHGIHGLQDLCCVLRRLGKSYFIEAGHYIKSDVVARAADIAKVCQAAVCLKKSRIGIIGEPFENMGDFALPLEEIEGLLGVKTVRLGRDDAAILYDSINASELANQIKRLDVVFSRGEGFDDKYMRLAAECTLTVKKWVERENLDGFTFNFLDFNYDLGLPAVPFTAASLMMSEGYGYAGEGDVLTAAFTAALMNIYPDSTFTEMFCPDWEGDTVFLSHMSEANCQILMRPTQIKKSVPYVMAVNGGNMPGVSGAYKAGSAVLANLAPGKDGEFRLLLSPCEIIAPECGDAFGDCIRGWLKPEMSLEIFLKEYSIFGGTHHSCLCYGADPKILKIFGELNGWNVRVLAAQ